MNARKPTFLVYNPVNTAVFNVGGIPRQYYEIPVRITQDPEIVKAYPQNFIVLTAPAETSGGGFTETTVEGFM